MSLWILGGATLLVLVFLAGVVVGTREPPVLSESTFTHTTPPAEECDEDQYVDLDDYWPTDYHPERGELGGDA